MTTRYLQKSHVGFHFSMGTLPSDDCNYGTDQSYFKACAPFAKAALEALPFWKQTKEEAKDAMQVAPYDCCSFDSEMECINGKMACSFWVDSQRLTLFPNEHVVAMRNAIASVMISTCVKVQAYTEYNETGYVELAL